MCTVCTSAIQSRILDIDLTVPTPRSAMFRTASSEKPNVSRASGLAVGRRCCPCALGIGVRMTSGVSRRCPGIRAADICDQTKGLLPILSVSRNGTFSRVRGQSTRVLEL
jgi:hypothetical protein